MSSYFLHSFVIKSDLGEPFIPVYRREMLGFSCFFDEE